jgi:hypothetical protein
MLWVLFHFYASPARADSPLYLYVELKDENKLNLNISLGATVNKFNRSHYEFRGKLEVEILG